MEEQVKQLSMKPGSCGTCTRPTHKAGECPGKIVECYDCGRKGHFKNSAVCRKRGKSKVKGRPRKDKQQRQKSRKVDESEEETTDHSDTDSIGRVVESVRASTNKESKAAEVKVQVLDHCKETSRGMIKLLVDSGVNKTSLSEKDWRTIQSYGGLKTRLRKIRTKFVPFGTSYSLPILGRVKCELTAKGGASMQTIIYVVKEAKESLLGLNDGEALGIIKIQPEGEIVKKLHVLTRSETQGNSNTEGKDEDLEHLIEEYKDIFKGLGRACKVPPIKIEVDPTVKPIQQKARLVPIHYKEKLRKHLDELIQEGVVTPLNCTNGTGWIHNVVITAKKWTEEKIRMNLDTRPMKKAIEVSHFHIPTPQELRHEFRGSDTFSVVDFNHAFHQFPMTKESSNLFVFHTPWGLHIS